MRLKEFEVKQLLEEEGMPIPKQVLITEKEFVQEFPNEKSIIKAQTLEGKREKRGGILRSNNKEETAVAVKRLLGSKLGDEPVEEVLVEELLAIDQEYYLAVMFDTDHRSPVILFSASGGIDIEGHRDKISLHSVNPVKGLSAEEAQNLLKQAGLQEDDARKLSVLLDTLYNTFVKYDFKMIEVNPVVKTTAGDFVAVDALGVTDDSAEKRQELPFARRTGLRKATEREKEARKIDADDYRGTAGSSFVELDGDIAVLASGGGASLTAMDGLLAYGGKPANYTEYSGDPPAEKVEKLTKITLSKPSLCGCWVVGGTANFTRIDKTMEGFIAGLKAIKPKYPIVVRRGGPGCKEAYELLEQAKQEHGFDIHLFDDTVPITKTAEIMVQLARKYKDGNPTE